jgi:hypothetical protein
MLVLGAIVVLSLATFGGGKTGKPGLLSNKSRAEQQLKLCVEGRPSVYGNPPTAAQQSVCTKALLNQAGGGSGVPAPLPAGENPSTTLPGASGTANTGLGTTTTTAFP